MDADFFFNHAKMLRTVPHYSSHHLSPSFPFCAFLLTRSLSQNEKKKKIARFSCYCCCFRREETFFPPSSDALFLHPKTLDPIVFSLADERLSTLVHKKVVLIELLLLSAFLLLLLLFLRFSPEMPTSG